MSTNLIISLVGLISLYVIVAYLFYLKEPPGIKKLYVLIFVTFGAICMYLIGLACSVQDSGRDYEILKINYLHGIPQDTVYIRKLKTIP